MVILYIYSTCWHMKSVFYEHQHNSSKMERKILGHGKNLFWELVPGVEVTLVSKFHLIWSNITQESNFGRKGWILGRKICSRDFLPDFVWPYRTLFENPRHCPTWTFSPMFIHDFGHILLIRCPIDLIFFRCVYNFEGIISTLLVGVFITFL
jgi:hypothetical protein